MSSFTKVSSSQRPSSRPGSASSSSASTVQRVASPTTRNVQRPPPTVVAQTLAPITPRITPTSEKRKKKPGNHSHTSSVSGNGGAAGNANRWSQSNPSNKPTAANHQRRNSFAKRLSGSFGSIGSYSNGQGSNATKNVLKKVNPSPSITPTTIAATTMALVTDTHEHPSRAHPSILPPVVTLPTLSQAVDSTRTPISTGDPTPTTADLLPSATYMPGNGDYFGKDWNSSSVSKRSNVANKSSSSANSKQIPLGGPMSQGSTNVPERGHRQYTAPSQSTQLPIHRSRDGDNLNGSSQPQTLNDSRDTGAKPDGRPSESSEHRHGDKTRRRKPPSQKAMLSKALQKANHAVVLDNAQNFEGAMDAYGDACDLLQQVMLRSSGDEDRRKLDAIRNTYRNRIKELQCNELSPQNANDKALPDVPSNRESKEQEAFSALADDEVLPVERATVRRLGEPLKEDSREDDTLTLTREQLPPRRQSLMPLVSNEEMMSDTVTRIQETADSEDAVGRDQPNAAFSSTNLSIPMDKDYMPPPLSPRRPLSPAVAQNSAQNRPAITTYKDTITSHSRQATAESTSWLDTIDESDGSSSSSVHSRSSSIGLRRKHIRTGSGVTEAEFDAALDAAVEAAYDDGYEPVSDVEDQPDFDGLMMSATHENVSGVRKNVEIAKQRVREAEREAAIVVAREHEKRRRLEQGARRGPLENVDFDYEDHEAEEEEKLLEEMTRGYILDETNYDPHPKSAVPRQSDSSGFSGRTWGSSVGSMPTTIGTPLSTVAESSPAPLLSNHTIRKTPPLPPPSTTLPQPPGLVPTYFPGQGQPPGSPRPSGPPILSAPGVRERRLSGQKVKQLKIDTSSRVHGTTKGQPSSAVAPPAQTQVKDEASKPPAEGSASDSLATPAKEVPAPSTSLQAPTHLLAPSPVEAGSGISPGASNSIKGRDQKDQSAFHPTSPHRPTTKSGASGILKKNFSSSSLKSLRQLNSTPPATDDSPGTPISRAFSASSQNLRNGFLPEVPDLPTPSLAAFAMQGMPAVNISFFDNDIHSPDVPGSPNPLTTNPPVPLEPCPESFLLRPFWLMRAIYQAIAHPRGGYISTRLFVPRDVWRVKNVKLKNIDEKVSNCDLLTAALQNLSKVDTFDADAVLEEMQAFELILDQVQGQLGKKLGADVGVSGSIALFKASPVADEPGSTTDTSSAKSSGTSGKSYLSSWRKLRSKTSATPGLPPTMIGSQTRDASREALTLRSLPMTNSLNSRVTKRDPTKVLGIGPHSHYMASLGRLCDAVQILDQIARQVEDPGLRLSSQTHVGLELCTRHAAEFFAFFVCRFALTDIGMMLDKFVKRGSEWVQA